MPPKSKPKPAPESLTATRPGRTGKEVHNQKMTPTSTSTLKSTMLKKQGRTTNMCQEAESRKMGSMSSKMRGRTAAKGGRGGINNGTGRRRATMKRSTSTFLVGYLLVAIVASFPYLYVHVVLSDHNDSAVSNQQARSLQLLGGLPQPSQPQPQPQPHRPSPVSTSPPFGDTLSALNVPFYMYEGAELDWWNSTSNTTLLRDTLERAKYSYKHFDDFWLLRGARQHPMRTMDPSEAKLFFVPILWNWVISKADLDMCIAQYDPDSPLPELSNYTTYRRKFCGTIITEIDPYEIVRRRMLRRFLHRADQALGRSPWFQKHQGRDHVIVKSQPNVYTKMHVPTISQTQLERLNQVQREFLERKAIEDKEVDQEVEQFLQRHQNKSRRRTKAERIQARYEKYWIYRQFQKAYRAVLPTSMTAPDKSAQRNQQQNRGGFLSNLHSCNSIGFESSMARADQYTEYFQRSTPLLGTTDLPQRQFPDSERLNIPSFYVGTPCEKEKQSNKIYDFSMIASINVEDPNYLDRMHLCDWLDKGNYSVGACGKGVQCPTLAKSKYGFHVRGDTWGANRLMDTVMSGTVPIFTAPQQYDIMPSFVPWKELSYYVNMTNQQTFIESMEHILSQPESEYQRKSALIEAYQPVFDHRQPHQMDLYLAEFAKRLGVQP